VPDALADKNVAELKDMAIIAEKNMPFNLSIKTPFSLRSPAFQFLPSLRHRRQLEREISVNRAEFKLSKLKKICSYYSFN
jgi:hypothetical protein